MQGRKPLHDGRVMALTRRDIDEGVYPVVREARDYLATARDVHAKPETSSLVAWGIDAVEVAAGCAAVGIAAGRFGTANIPGTPIPLGPAAGAAIGLAVGMGWIPRSIAPHAVGVGKGALGAWATMWGMGFGQGMRESAGLPRADVTIGASSPNGGARGSCFGGCSGTCSCASKEPRRMAPPMPAAAMPSAPPVGIGFRPLTEAELALAARNFRRAA